MSGNVDDAKGRVKEAVGSLTDDDSLKAEGKADRAAAKVKDLAESVKDKVEDGVDAIRDKLHHNN